MKACYYDRFSGDKVGEVTLSNGGGAVVKGKKPFVEGMRTLVVADENGPIKPSDGRKYIKALGDQPDWEVVE